MHKRKSCDASTRNPRQYSDPEGPPDFNKLAAHYPAFAKYIIHGKRRPTIDWRNTEAVKCLTHAILSARYGITLELPPDQLCPTVTLRANYIRFLQDLISRDNDEEEEKNVDERKEHRIKGLDIGTGASCIYPLLGVRMNPEWKFVGTDISRTSIEYAQKNVDKNGASDSIELRLQSNPEQIFKGVLNEDDDEQFSFTMCNPPFFSDTSEACQNPNGTCTASDHEAVTDGGEERFVEKMILESAEFPSRAVWWTTMLGKKKSLKPLVKVIEKMQLRTEVVTGELVQGKTTRWVLAWTFRKGVCEPPQKRKARRVLSSPVTVFTSSSQLDFSRIAKAIEEWSLERGFDCDVSSSLEGSVLCSLDLGKKKDSGEENEKVDVEFTISEGNNKALVMKIVGSGGDGEEEDPNKLMELHFKSITAALCDLSKMLRRSDVQN